MLEFLAGAVAVLGVALWAVLGRLKRANADAADARRRVATQKAMREFEHDAQSAGDVDLANRISRGGL
jgi:hypothetical protein